MKSMIGLYPIDSGEVLYDGRNIGLMNRKEIKELRKEIGMLFQGSALFDSQTVIENGARRAAGAGGRRRWRSRP